MPGGESVAKVVDAATEVIRGPNIRGRSVLIVEDEPAVREMFGEMMIELGCEATLVRDSAQALDVFASDTFDVVFLDQSLPGMQGDELASILRDRDPAVAIVLVSGWGRENVLAGADTNHVDLTAAKPLEILRVVELLSEGSALAERRRATPGRAGNLDSKPEKEAE